MLTPVDTQYAAIALAGRAILAALFLYLYRLRHNRYLFYSTLAWVLLALSSLPPVLFPSSLPVWLATSFAAVLTGLGVLAFLDSAHAFSQGQARLRWTVVLSPVLIVWVVVENLVGGFFQQLPATIGLAGVTFVTGMCFAQESRRRQLTSGLVLGVAFGLWGAFLLTMSFGSFWLGSLAGWGGFLLHVPEQVVAVSLVILVYQHEKQNLERQLLDLAGLNMLSGASQHAGTLHEMITQTLERLLGAVRMSAAMAAVHNGAEAPVVLTHGRVGGFFPQVERLGLLADLQQTVLRLGGLIVVPEVDAPSASAALSRSPELERLSQLAKSEGARSLVAASLRTKTGERGLLLLISPEVRRFSQAELRLLLGLGVQIGMAVENFHLQQETARRTEELRLLNEIGRAVSSALSMDELVTRVYAEIQRVTPASNFYIAVYDALQEEVSFVLEVRDGNFLPKRTRRARNGLTEYILRTKEPLLIRENFDAVMNELKVEPGRTAKSFCAVPILLHGEPRGVLGLVSHAQEEAFDSGHVDILTILAAQMAVAMENARLFEAEQSRSRHLELLNNVSRRAISTLNPEEMLAAIAAELHVGLPYDHIGLGVMDYATREVVIQAEAGHGAQGLNRRFKLGEACVGRVAQSGTLRQYNDLSHPEEMGTVLPDAAALVCLPIVYGDQLLGVLNIESRQRHAFRDKDALLLRTLADQIASALHNAYVFQHAQEQAITDGLTGVKTHRYFIEALNSEWRRATRAARPFSLVLLDLDKFKFVNDYFGHLEGDTVLQRVGRVLEQNVRRSDVVARYGGDEFVVLMPETNAEQAYTLADKLRSWLANDPLLRERKITASLGLATYPQHAATAPELIQIADASMYLAKHQGGNVIVSADHFKKSEQKEWQRNVLEAYLGVTIKRLFATGPEAFNEVYHRLEQVIRSLGGGDETQELPAAVLETVTSLAFAIDAKDHYTQGHSQNVSRYCTLVARHLGLSDKEVEQIRLAGVLHDVGKIGVPERILNKPSPLSEEEFEQMKEHAVLGAKILEPLRSISRIQEMVRHHHERWDGKGYPDGLRGEAAPLGARLINIADAFDTMISERTYKRALSRMEALAELERCAGAQFDPKLVKAFVTVVKQEGREEKQTVVRAQGVARPSRSGAG